MPINKWRLSVNGPAVALALLFGLGSQAQAAMHRFWLASQHDWGARRGFYLNFENTSEGEAPCRLETLRLYLGVADGREWRFVSTDVKWETDREYQVAAIISPQGSELRLDGALVAKNEGRFAPDPGRLFACHIPGWASGKTDYIILQTSLRICGGEGKPIEISFPGKRARPLPVLIFEPSSERQLEWRADPARTFSIAVTFEILPYPDLRSLAPFIDRYGQCRYADWPGKVRSDEDQKRDAREEEGRLGKWGVPRGYDRYGGYRLAGWREKATGFYRVAQRSGFWWLISPEGNPCFFLGICTAPAPSWDQTPTTGRQFLFEWLPPREAPYSAAWGGNPWGSDPGIEYVAPHTSNLIRKYGPDWERHSKRLLTRRLRAWGFSGIGKWGGMEDTPYLPVLSRAGVPNLVKHPDIFDPEIQAKFREALRRQIEPRRGQPICGRLDGGQRGGRDRIQG